MSAFTAEPARSDEFSDVVGHGATVPGSGQRHDRISVEQQDNYTMSQQGNGGRDSDISAAQKMISATWGSIFTTLLVTPLDVVRVRLQSQSQPRPAPNNPTNFPAYSANFTKLPQNLGVTACCREVFWVGDNASYCMVGTNANSASAIPSASTSAADCAVEETQRKTFTSTFDGLRKIARNEGPLTLWRGLSPTLLMAIPGNVIYFTGYDWLRYNHMSPVSRSVSDTYAPFVAGAGARVAAGIVVSPIEMLRTRMQAVSGAETGIFRSTVVGLHQLAQSRGYSSLWRGLTLTLWRDVPFSGIYWWGYEAVRNSLTDFRHRQTSLQHGPGSSSLTSNTSSRRASQVAEHHTTTFVDSFIAGFASGGLAAFVTTPFDVGKTRQQVYKHATDEGKPPAASSKAHAAGKLLPEERSMPRFLLHIFKEERFAGLFKGWGPRCLKVAPACAIMISCYEVGKKWARKVNESRADGLGEE